MEHSAQCRPQSVAAAVTAALGVNHTHTEQAWGLPSTTVLFIPMPVVAHSPSFFLEPAPVGTGCVWSPTRWPFADVQRLLAQDPAPAGIAKLLVWGKPWLAREQAKGAVL